MTTPRKIKHFALILAAGLSTRMGTCKTTLPWRNNQTLLKYQVEQFLLANITPIVVLGSHNAARRSDCPDRSQVVINEKSNLGKTSSVLAGLNVLPTKFSTLTISAVDQPRSTHIYQTLLQAHRKKKSLITAPCYQDKLGHPLLFSYNLLPQIKQIDESSFGLRKIVQKRYLEINKVNFDNSEILIDMNHRNTYQLYFSSKSDRFKIMF